MRNLFLGSLLTLICMPVVVKAEEAVFKSISLSGRGCSDSTSSVVLSPDRAQASILFDELNVQVPIAGMDDLSSQIEKLIDRKICNMTIKLEVPADERVTGVEFQTDMRGLVVTEYGTEAELDARIISWKDSGNLSKNQSELVFNKLYRGGVDQDLMLSENTFVNVNSNCSPNRKTEVEFVVRSFLRAEVVTRSRDLPSAYLGIDSSDMNGNFKIKLHKKSCRNVSRPDVPTTPTTPTRPTRPTRPGRVDRDKIELCRQLGGVWHEQQGTCIQVFGRR